MEIGFSTWIEILKLQLDTTGSLLIKPQGKSMYPLMETDNIIRIAKKKDYQVGDIVLFEKKGHLILHRIIYKTKEGVYILVGDNSHGYEDRAEDFEILGAAEGISYKNQREIEIKAFYFYNYITIKYARIFRRIRHFTFLGERKRYIAYRILHFLFYCVPIIIYRLEYRGIHEKKQKTEKI